MTIPRNVRIKSTWNDDTRLVNTDRVMQLNNFAEGQVESLHEDVRNLQAQLGRLVVFLSTQGTLPLPILNEVISDYSSEVVAVIMEEK
jgi:hypothetical protein